MQWFVHCLWIIFFAFVGVKLLTRGSYALAPNSDDQGETFPFGQFKSLFQDLVRRVLGPEELEIQSQLIQYVDPVDGTQLTGQISYPTNNAVFPGILVVHDWDGRDEFEDGKALALARLGYVALAVDVYGQKGGDPQLNRQLMQPLLDDRTLLVRRLRTALDLLRSQQRVAKDKIGAIGFCFGGLAVLDMARAGIPLRGVVSFHGNLKASPESFTTEQIVAKILVAHGHEDTSIPPEMVLDFETEMTSRGADWQVHVYGNGTLHAFTRPGNRYSFAADRRSWRAMRNFFEEVFDD